MTTPTQDLYLAINDAAAKRAAVRDALIACVRGAAAPTEAAAMVATPLQHALHASGINPKGWPDEAECRQHLASIRRDVARGFAEDLREVTSSQVVELLEAALALAKLYRVEVEAEGRVPTVEVSRLRFRATTGLAASTASGTPASELEAATVTAQANEPAAGTKVKRNVLIDNHRARWPSVERDLKDAASNDLAASAKAGRGFWIEESALAWARARGKYHVVHATEVIGILTHKLKG